MKSYVVRLDKDGVPIDMNDWTYDDWVDLHYGIVSIKKRIAKRHKRENMNDKSQPDPVDNRTK